ncbi:MAG TPA: thioredoxin-disulfide reductase [Smithella sp.]|nr:thioredoxin-disulfide reductase [Smithella sp.]MDM7987900.1 thioredoxin-disulfide reductase [Smithella sp.]HNY50585.1 thioredoxin-disulfide reductase [Smithella sp.]HOG89152.1 thioredoxin-disulfide reductase [Smithella sp.]HOU51694.1 thioredoxin-disulfide reductase [Smithella sp.]
MSKTNLPQYDYDTIIIGGGPAGYTAGIYAARSGMKTLLIEGAATVSQITITDLIENYPGIPDGINGFDLMQLFKKQALHFGLEMVTGDVQSITQNSTDPIIWDVILTDKLYRTLSVIAATGAQWNKLGVPGEEEFAGKGVSYCATCDGPFYRDRDVVVVGGGDTAIQEALFLTHFARKVTVIHRRDRLRAAAILQKRAFAEKKIEFAWQSTLAGITGKDFVTGVKVADVPSGVIRDIEAEGVFIFVGLTPNTAVFRDVLSLDKGGYIITDDNMKTSAAGVFAAGDCRAKPFRQVVTAAGDGANAIHSAELYVDALKGRTY